MNSTPLSTSFDEKLYAATRVPQPSPDFVAALRARLDEAADHPERDVRPNRFGAHRSLWVTVGVTAVVLLAILFALGPQRVLAAVRQWLGYIPGIGIVDQSAPIRLLAEPASLTREGVTVLVNRAILTADQTRIEYGVSGVPLSAYPRGEAVTGCIEQEYLRLPDGTEIAASAPVPSGVNTATFVLPCIFDTLPGSVPEDWELTLRFVPAPADMTVLPIIELTPTQTAVASTLAAPPTASQAGWATVEKVIETSDGYILIGAFRPRISDTGWAQVNGVPQMRDANGARVEYTTPEDIQLPYDDDMSHGGFPFAFQIKTAGLAFPLTIEFPGEVYSPVEPSVSAEVEFDAGPDPQPGQEWKLDQDVRLGDYTVHLTSITAGADGYSFVFVLPAGVSQPSIQIEGYQAVGAGGGSGGVSLVYAELPKGKLKIVFSDLFVVTETTTWTAEWQPDTLRSEWLTPTQNASTACLSAGTLERLEPPPNDLTGQVLLTVLNPDINLVITDLHGSQPQVLVPGGSRGALSPDGLRVTYSAAEGIAVTDLASGETSTLTTAGGRDLHWSPEGSRIAFVTAGDVYGIFVAPLDGSAPRQYSDLGYESIAGWSPDGQQLYYAIPDAGGKGWLLRSVDVTSGETQDLFVLENSSRKAPFPEVSPDGAWIAYRGVDNASLYLMRMDGSQGYLVIEASSEISAISGIVWGPDSEWLGVSVMTPAAQQGEVVLVQPQSCAAYLLPELQGELDGWRMP